MSEELNYKWCQKIHRYKINDPFLRLVVEKYESEIPWVINVRDEKTLNSYLSDVMLPELKKRVTYNEDIKDIPKKSFFVSFLDIDPETQIELMEYASENELRQARLWLSDKDLFGDEEYNHDWGRWTKEEYEKKCRDMAAFELQTVINKYKSEAYLHWIEFMQEVYPIQPAFQLLVLRSVFIQAGYGSRQLLNPPDKNVLKWLNQNIKQLKISPKDNIGKEYHLRVTNGLHSKLFTGWQYIESGTQNSSRLSSAAQRSGWCIAGEYMSKYYLSSCEFYILRVKNKPVVAIRRMKNGKILEILGVHNRPSPQFFSDISFFIQTMSFEFEELNASDPFPGDWDTMLPDFKNFTERTLSENINNATWWSSRIERWPFAWEFAPEGLKQKCKPTSSVLSSNAFYLSLPEDMIEKAGVKLTIDDYEEAISQDPSLFNSIGITDEPRLIAACVKGAINKMNNNDITLKEFSELPEWVRTDKSILDLLSLKVPKSFEKEISRRGNYREERSAGKQMGGILGFEETEHQEISVLRAVEMIIKNESSDFSNIIFTEEIRNRPDFEIIREKAWIKALNNNPTFYFALPLDLFNRRAWEPLTTIPESKEALLKKWQNLVLINPWYLETKSKVPKSIRNHESLLRAYLLGWSKIIASNPSRIWKKINPYQRAYCSYAALRNFYFFSNLSNAFENDPKSWGKSSDRMKAIPAYQLAMLAAASKNGTLTKLLRSKQIKPLFPLTTIREDHDLQRQLVYYFINGNQIKARDQLLKQPNYFVPFFNYLEPSEPYERRVTNGDRLLIEVNGTLYKYSIGHEAEGFEKLLPTDPDTKRLFGLKQGESTIISGNSVKVVEILKF
jgi:hypothetical protein